MIDMIAAYSRVADRERIPMWVLYDHPRDVPTMYVARIHYSLPDPTPSVWALGSPDVEAMRAAFAALGFTKIPRNEGDDPKIMESWLI